MEQQLLKQGQLLIAVVVMGDQSPKKKSVYQRAANYVTAEECEADFEEKSSIAVLAIFL